MMTRTSAADYHADGIHMNSVDTGWVTDEDPVEIAARKTAEQRFHPPLDIVDGAARIVDPIIEGFQCRSGTSRGRFLLKDYGPLRTGEAGPTGRALRALSIFAMKFTASPPSSPLPRSWSRHVPPGGASLVRGGVRHQQAGHAARCAHEDGLGEPARLDLRGREGSGRDRFSTGRSRPAVRRGCCAGAAQGRFPRRYRGDVTGYPLARWQLHAANGQSVKMKDGRNFFMGSATTPGAGEVTPRWDAPAIESASARPAFSSSATPFTLFGANSSIQRTVRAFGLWKPCTVPPLKKLRLPGA